MAERPVWNAVQLGRVLMVTQWPYVALLAVAAFLPPLPSAMTALAASLILSSALHESGHALAYWRLFGSDREVVIRTRLLVTVAIRTASPASSRLVAAAGPLLPTTVGLALLAQYFWGSGGTLLAIIGGACSFHVLGLLPGNSDGDKLWLLD